MDNTSEINNTLQSLSRDLANVVEQAGGAAAKAGVQRGDVIIGVGSSAVNSVDELRSAVDKSGKTVADIAPARAKVESGTVLVATPPPATQPAADGSSQAPVATTTTPDRRP